MTSSTPTWCAQPSLAILCHAMTCPFPPCPSRSCHAQLFRAVLHPAMPMPRRAWLLRAVPRHGLSRPTVSYHDTLSNCMRCVVLGRVPVFMNSLHVVTQTVVIAGGVVVVGCVWSMAQKRPVLSPPMPAFIAFLQRVSERIACLLFIPGRCCFLCAHISSAGNCSDKRT